jgi:cardiolipin synthase
VNGYLIAAVVALSLLSAVLALFIWSAKRHRDPTLRIEGDSPISELMPSLAGLSLHVPISGNSIEIQENGAFFDVLIEAIASARKSVHFETFLWKDGTLGRRLAAALAERARAGLKVRVLVDAIGSKDMGKATEEELLAAGVLFTKFHPITFWNIGVVNERDHRKLAVIDGETAFVGGHCIVDEWLGDAQDSKHYGDLSIRMRGPIVTAVQAVFSENWAGETGELFLGDDVFPHLDPAGDVTAHVSFLKPESSAPAVKILHHTVLCLARERIWIQNPYFIPEREAIDALADAVRRGVDVRVMVPTIDASDNALVQHASHFTFDRLLRCGVRIFEFPRTLLHQKVMTIDGVWSAIGSSNFDDRSFEINDELSISILDASTAQQLEAIFQRYLPECREIRLEEWRKRGLLPRAKGALAYAVNEIL